MLQSRPRVPANLDCLGDEKPRLDRRGFFCRVMEEGMKKLMVLIIALIETSRRSSERRSGYVTIRATPEIQRRSHQ